MMMMKADGFHSGHGVLTRQMASELQMKKEVREDNVEEEEVMKKERRRGREKGGVPSGAGGPRSRVSLSHLIKMLVG
ncbi:hypothetical protein FF1_046981 [Malus domestica]